MFTLKTKFATIATQECPKRAAKGGKPYLSVALDGNPDFPILVVAHDGDAPATVNGYPVWDLKRNEWAEYEGADGEPFSWEESAERASLRDAEPAVVGVSDVVLGIERADEPEAGDVEADEPDEPDVDEDEPEAGDEDEE